MLLLSFALASGPTLVDPAVPLVSAAPHSRVGLIIESAHPLDVGVWAPSGRVEAALHDFHDGVGVYFVDLPVPADQVVLDLPSGAGTVQAELFTPAPEPVVDGPVPPPAPGVLPSELVNIGVVSRSDWGASSTNCSTLENDWYRMAIHHTAGSQTSGGSVEGAVRALQSYSMGSGTFCDVPYQFLVGYDGTLYEGRPYDYYSGATGGGNNDGNIAISFLGCYDADGCSTSHAVTAEMMEAGQLLVHTLAALHDVPLNSDSIRGHQDWPNNATACPGDLLHPRLDELWGPMGPRWSAVLVDSSFDLDGLVLSPGETVSLWLDFENTGSETWTSNTKLATLPRDSSSPLQASDWLSSGRLTSVDNNTSEGQTGRFSFSLKAPSEEGTVQQSLGLVEEAVIWFADDGGPAEDAVVVSVEVRRSQDTNPPDDTDSQGSDSGRDVGGDGVLPPGEQVRMVGCGLPGAPTFAVGLVALLMVRRRR